METDGERGRNGGRAKILVSQLQWKKSMKLLIDFLQRVSTTRTYNHLDLASFGIVGLFSSTDNLVCFFLQFVCCSFWLCSSKSACYRSVFVSSFSFFFQTFNVNELLSTTLIAFANSIWEHTMRWQNGFTFSLFIFCTHTHTYIFTVRAIFLERQTERSATLFCSN